MDIDGEHEDRVEDIKIRIMVMMTTGMMYAYTHACVHACRLMCHTQASLSVCLSVGFKIDRIITHNIRPIGLEESQTPGACLPYRMDRLRYHAQLFNPEILHRGLPGRQNPK